MRIDWTLKDYRCFPDSHPARLAIRKGMTAFVGPNNSGKSALLRFFYEFRDLFLRISEPSGSLLDALRGNRTRFNLQGIADISEVFSNETPRDLRLEIDASPEDGDGSGTSAPLSRVVFEVPRGQNVFTVRELRTPATAFQPAGNISWAQLADGAFYLTRDGAEVAWLKPLFAALRPLARTTYIGAFRNAINVGGNQSYFDIQVGEQFLHAWRRFKTGASKQQATAAVRLTDDIKHIFGFADLEINTTVSLS